MARISYDDQTAAAYKAVREIPRDGLGEWRAAIRRHLNPLPGMTVADIGAGLASSRPPVLIRQGFPGRLDRVDNVRWFPKDPTVDQTCQTPPCAPSPTRNSVEAKND